MSRALIPPAEQEARLAAVRLAVAEAGAAAMLIDQAELLAWATGYTVSETMYRAAVVPLSGASFWVLRRLDLEPCLAATWLPEVTGFADDADPHVEVANGLMAHGLGAAALLVDSDSHGHTLHTRQRLAALLPDAHFIDRPGLSDWLRRCKSETEIALLREAAAIGDAAMEAIRAACQPGLTARAAAAIAAGEFLRRGADGGETGPILRAAGDMGFLHGARDDTPLAEGDVLHVELTPRRALYSARIMRPIVAGRDRRGIAVLVDRLVAMQDAQIAAMRPGIEARAADAVLREAALGAGLRREFTNVSGYSLGLYGRTPRASNFSHALHPGAAWRLEEGMVFHLYVSAGGAAISETVVVRETGGERLSGLPRSLLSGGVPPEAAPD
jgi:Xaa-Pro aminopeptidase